MTPTRTLAAASLALLAVLAAPAPAFADTYPPGGGAAVVSVACASTYSAEPGYFSPNETVTIEIVSDSEDAAAAAKSDAAVASTSMSKHTAAADGSLVYTLPKATAVAGQYELTTWGTISPERGPILYSPAQECLGTSPAAEQAPPGGLPNTGADLSWLWLSGGLIFTGLLALGAVHLVRRRSV